MGSSQADRALDDADLALRFGHRRAGLPDALKMVPASGAPIMATKGDVKKRQNLALFRS
jgi:hypothetical protein